MADPKKHINRKPFTGILTVLDAPSDISPSGARGHKILVTGDAASDALSSLIGMGICYRADWSGHNERCKIGVITDARIADSKIHISGHLYAKDFPEVIESIKAQGEELGLSYELHDARVIDMREAIWTIDRITFTGAAILKREKAAYRNSSFSLDSE
jgi:hypothetical protein